MSREDVVAAVEQLLEDGAELEDVEQFLAQLELTEEQAEQTEEETEPTYTPGEWNIKAQANGDPVQARKIAESLTRRLKRLYQAIHEDEVVVAEQKAKLDGYLKRRQETTERQERWLLERLEEYKNDFHPGERTVKLIAGTLQHRALPSRPCWDDPRARSWAEQHPDAERLLKVELRREEIKRRLSRRGHEYLDPRTGEIVDFLKQVASMELDRFSVS